jgi:hypothetical protein
MKVCILGCARSGTTALYSFLQHIMEEHYPQQVEYVYEPFLWDYQVFNGKYNELVNKFNFVDSLSFEGIYQHLQLPLFINDPTPYQNNDYLTRLFSPGTAGKSLLLKFIRANGRYLLLNAAAPGTKFIFILRNPADTVNSVSRLFSFYGGELHRDDFSRFLKEINQVYKTNFSKDEFEDQTQKELLYWYYMNRFALESFGKTGNKPLILCHEEKVENNPGVIEKLCRFLGIPFKDHYIEQSNWTVGYNTKRVDISKQEFQLYNHYLDMYIQLLDHHHIPVKLDKKKILEKYEIQEDHPPRERTLYGLTALKLIDKFKETQHQLAQKTQLVDQKEKLSAKKGLELERSLMTIRSKDEQLKNHIDTIDQKNLLIAQKDTAIEELNRLIQRNDTAVNNLNLIVEQKNAAIKEQITLIEQKNTVIKNQDNLIEQKNVVIKEQKIIIEQKDTVIKNQDNLIQQKNAVIKEQGNLIQQKNTAVNERDRLIEKKDTIITEHELQIKQKEFKIKNQGIVVEELRAKLDKLYQSYSWRIGHSIVGVIKFFFGWTPFVKKYREKSHK